MTPGPARSRTLGKRLYFRRAVLGGRIPALKISEISEIFNFCVFCRHPTAIAFESKSQSEIFARYLLCFCQLSSITLLGVMISRNLTHLWHSPQVGISGIIKFHTLVLTKTKSVQKTPEQLKVICEKSNYESI